MKFKVSMKDPDTLSDAIQEAIEQETDGITDPVERKLVQQRRHERAYADCSMWFRYGEYLTVEIDTEARTCVVVPVHS